MPEPLEQPNSGNRPAQPAAGWRRELLQRHRWLVFLLPLVVFMLAGSLEPTRTTPGGAAIGLNIPYTAYPMVYCLRIALTVAAILFVWPGYREFAFRVSPLAIAVGAVGVVVWVGLCSLDIERGVIVPLLEPIGLGGLIDSGTRSGFNPLDELKSTPIWAHCLLVIRFLGLAAVVPLIEEFFLRGFIMRFVMEKDWWKIPIGKASGTAIVAATLIPMAMHPAELLAAAVWFSMITGLLLWTRNIWDCVAAHAVTNLLLGIYVVVWNKWHLM